MMAVGPLFCVIDGPHPRPLGAVTLLPLIADALGLCFDDERPFSTQDLGYLTAALMNTP